MSKKYNVNDSIVDELVEFILDVYVSVSGSDGEVIGIIPQLLKKPVIACHTFTFLYNSVYVKCRRRLFLSLHSTFRL